MEEVERNPPGCAPGIAVDRVGDVPPVAFPMEYDAVIVGAGPNGLAAAINLQRRGLRTLLIEGSATVGGGARTAELTLPGYRHDICSAVHPTGAASPFFQSLSLERYGLEFIHPDIAAVHPFEGGTAAVLHRSLGRTAQGLGCDGDNYVAMIEPHLRCWPRLSEDVWGPMRWPRHPALMTRFGIHALRSAERLAKRFATREGRGLWAGMCAHAGIPLSRATSSAVGLVLLVLAHSVGWPLARGGSQAITEALAACYRAHGGRITTGWPVATLAELPASRAVLLDVTPRQALRLAGPAFSGLYQRQLRRHRHGPGVFKVDWALRDPVPFLSQEARAAGTVHLGGTLEEVAWSEREVADGRCAERPFVLFTQASRFDASRAPEGRHTGWAYCHVPFGSTEDRTEAIERQVERFAPGFRDLILARRTHSPAQMQAHNPNYVGGDISGGVMDLGQLFNRPALRLSPYRTSAKHVYLCSSSTPPGGGVHGMCGFHASERAWADLFS